MGITEIIQPEIKDDEFYAVISQIGAQLPARHILEIGSSSGAGSTEAWVKGITQNSAQPTLHCIEVSRPRFEVLQRTYASNKQVKCHWTSSVDLSRFPSKKEVIDFYHSVPSILNQYSLEQVLGWLEQDIDYIASAKAPTDGIRKILRDEQIYTFDAVLIDGSEFLGAAEFSEIYGAPIILLDDICGYKCHFPYQWLKKDPSYKCVAENTGLRNGYAAFQKIQ
ncbi:hypothetical protein MRY87_02060 [bacterium]|nr:hypothetical protein [bacterium]